MELIYCTEKLQPEFKKVVISKYVRFKCNWTCLILSFHSGTIKQLLDRTLTLASVTAQ